MRLLLAAFPLITLLLGGCSAGGPPDASVKKALEERYGRLGIVQIESTKHFEVEGSGTGRTSVAGKVTFPEPLYALRRNTLPEILKAKGIPQYEVDYVAKQLGLIPQGAIYSYNPRVYEVILEAEQATSFTAELAYREGAQGFEVAVLDAEPFIEGDRSSDLKTGSYIDGSDDLSALVRRIEDATAAHRAHVTDTRMQIEKSLVSRLFFLSEPDSVYDAPLIWRDRYTVDVADTMMWTQRTPNLHNFEVPATVTILRTTRVEGEDRSPGETISTHIEGGINLDDGRGVWVQFDGTLKPLSGGGYAERYTRLLEAPTPEPPSVIVEPKWKVATVSTNRLAKFNLRSTECMMVRAAEVATGQSLIFFDDNGDGQIGTTMPEPFTIEGPKRGAGIGYTAPGKAQFQYWRYRRTDGSC